MSSLARILFVITLIEGTLQQTVIERVREDVRIVGGFPALTESTKHQVSIRVRAWDATFGDGHWCGGSLIDNQTVLTAAHCLFDLNYIIWKPDDLIVVLGTLDRTNKTANTIVSNVSEVIAHKCYNTSAFKHDVGLLILDTPIDLTGNLSTIGTIDLVSSSPDTGTVCQTSGWGLQQAGNSSTAPNFLMAVNITVQSFDVCNSISSYNGHLSEGMLCVGNLKGGTDSCQGDSGGPLVCNGQLAGMVSWGNGCALPNFPGIYTDVAHYRQWIDSRGNNSAVECTNSTTSTTTTSTSTTSTTTTSTTTAGNGSSISRVNLIVLVVGTVSWFWKFHAAKL